MDDLPVAELDADGRSRGDEDGVGVDTVALELAARRPATAAGHATERVARQRPVAQHVATGDDALGGASPAVEQGHEREKDRGGVSRAGQRRE